MCIVSYLNTCYCRHSTESAHRIHKYVRHKITNIQSPNESCISTHAKKNTKKKFVLTKCYWLVQKDLADDSICENGYSESSMYGD